MKTYHVDRLVGALLAQEDDNFHQYCVERADLLDDLQDVTRKILILNAPRGSGKSGLLMSLEEKLKRAPSHRIFRKFPTDLSFPQGEPSVNEYASFWRNSILGWIVADIGTQTTFAFTDDDIAAVGLASQSGVKPRDFLEMLFKRLKINGSPLERMQFDETLNANQALRLINQQSKTFWVLLDEMDDNFEATRSFEHRLVGLFEAAHAIARGFPRIKIRISIRPHIFTHLKTHHEKVQIYTTHEVPIHWELSQLREILSKRIRFHDLKIDNTHQDLPSLKLSDKVVGDYEILNRYFDDFDLTFKAGSKSEYRALATLSFFRPRWLLELCRQALIQAKGNRATTIDFQKALFSFGNNRKQFTISEHRSHFPLIEKALNWLEVVRKTRFEDTSELLRLIHETFPFEGIMDQETKLALTKKIAQMLFVLEIIRPLQDLGGGRDNHRFLYYVDNPELLTTLDSIPKVEWQVHPTFASALLIDYREAYRPGSGSGEIKLIRERVKERELSKEKTQKELQKLDALKLGRPSVQEQESKTDDLGY